MLAPAANTMVPVDVAAPVPNAATLFSALEEALTVNDIEPTPDADAKEMLFPPNRATLILLRAIEVPPPLNDCAPAALTDSVIELAPVSIPILAPATRTIVPVLVAPAVPNAAT